MHSGVVDLHATLGHHLLEISQAQRVGGVPTHAHQHHLQREVQPFDYAAQRRVRQLDVQGNHWTILANPPYCDRTFLFRFYEVVVRDLTHPAMICLWRKAVSGIC